MFEDLQAMAEVIPWMVEDQGPPQALQILEISSILRHLEERALATVERWPESRGIPLVQVLEREVATGHDVAKLVRLERRLKQVLLLQDRDPGEIEDHVELPRLLGSLGKRPVQSEAEEQRKAGRGHRDEAAEQQVSF